MYSLSWLLFVAIVVFAPIQIRFTYYTREKRAFPGWKDISWGTREECPSDGTRGWVYFAFAALLLGFAIFSLGLPDKSPTNTESLLLKLVAVILEALSFTLRWGIYYVAGGQDRGNFWATAWSVYRETGLIVDKKWFIRWPLAFAEGTLALTLMVLIVRPWG